MVFTDKVKRAFLTTKEASWGKKGKMKKMISQNHTFTRWSK